MKFSGAIFMTRFIFMMRGIRVPNLLKVDGKRRQMAILVGNFENSNA